MNLSVHSIQLPTRRCDMLPSRRVITPFPRGAVDLLVDVFPISFTVMILSFSSLSVRLLYCAPAFSVFPIHFQILQPLSHKIRWFHCHPLHFNIHFPVTVTGTGYYEISMLIMFFTVVSSVILCCYLYLLFNFARSNKCILFLHHTPTPTRPPHATLQLNGA